MPTLLTAGDTVSAGSSLTGATDGLLNLIVGPAGAKVTALSADAAGNLSAFGGGRVFNRGNILGVVSQTAGVPTGAVIERDLNANGEWVRFADGMLICTVRVTSTTQAFTLYISPIHISNYTWTFPAGFIAAPVVNCSEFRWGTSASWAGVATTASTSNVVLRGYDGAPNATGTATIISATAIGRWF